MSCFSLKRNSDQTTFRAHSSIRPTPRPAQSLLTTIVTDSSVQLDASTLVDDTFQDALFSQITKTVTSAFAILLAEMDRNGNLRLLALHDASQLALSTNANSNSNASAGSDALTSKHSPAVSAPSEAESRALSAIWLALFPLYDQLRMMKSDKSQVPALAGDEFIMASIDFKTCHQMRIDCQ